MMEAAEFVVSSVNVCQNTQHHNLYNRNLVDLAVWVTVNSFKGESNGFNYAQTRKFHVDMHNLDPKFVQEMTVPSYK